MEERFDRVSARGNRIVAKSRAGSWATRVWTSHPLVTFDGADLSLERNGGTMLVHYHFSIVWSALLLIAVSPPLVLLLFHIEGPILGVFAGLLCLGQLIYIYLRSRRNAERWLRAIFRPATARTSFYSPEP